VVSPASPGYGAEQEITFFVAPFFHISSAALWSSVFAAKAQEMCSALAVETNHVVFFSVLSAVSEYLRQGSTAFFGISCFHCHNFVFAREEVMAPYDYWLGWSQLIIVGSPYLFHALAHGGGWSIRAARTGFLLEPLLVPLTGIYHAASSFMISVVHSPA